MKKFNKNIRAILSPFSGILSDGIGKSSQGLRKAAKGALLGLVAGLIVLFSIGGCGCPKHCTGGGSENTTVIIRDSIITQIDTVEVQLPPEVIEKYVEIDDMLRMETSTAKAWAAVDNKHHLLVGGMENKPTITVPVEEHQEYHQSDSTHTVEIPVPYEVIKYKTPSWCWWLLGGNILLLVLVGLWIYFKLKVRL